MRLFVDSLTNLDFSYLHPERGLVGETWLASIVLHGALDEQGMVCDFGEVKKIIREWLDTHIDHKLLVPKNAENVLISEEHENQTIQWFFNNEKLKTSAPRTSHCLVDTHEIEQSSVARWAESLMRPLFPESVEKLELSFKTENIAGPFYHYSHGLKKHLGNCQRIAHGHRSKIEIKRDGQLDLKLMQQIATDWSDIYLGLANDCIEDQEINGNMLFSYEAQQGKFALSLPKTSCYLLPTETTVELIAQYLAKKLKNKDPDASYQVKAFEGLAKGAIAQS